VNAVISPAYTRVVQAGNQVRLTHQLLNTGNATDTFVLTYTQTLTWNIVLQPLQHTLEPNQQASSIMLHVDVPANALRGSTNRIRLQARSQSDPTKVFEVESLVIVAVTYNVYLPLVQR